MDPDRKRKIRLGVALGAAVLLASALVYVSFSASSEARQPSEVLDGGSGERSEMTGVVSDEGSCRSKTSPCEFEVADRDDPSASVPVLYSGTVPDPFREGREVIVKGTMQNGLFVAEKDSLVTKCPSKFKKENQQ